jgi:hypothetical protein
MNLKFFLAMVNFKRYLPHLSAILFFVLLAYLFTPQVFEKKVVNQSDIASWRGMANEIISYNEANPDKDPALWTNSMFSGMPATTISVIYQGDYTDFLYKLIHGLSGTRPPSYLLISLIGSFLLMLAFGVNVPLAAIGAVAITFCSYNMQIIQVGHNSKMVAIAFMPWVLAAVVYAYRKSILFGALFFAFALSFQIKANHPQITYYLAIMVIGFGMAEFYKAIKERYFALFLKKSLLLLMAGLLGIAVNINHLWPTYEYSKYTMRGGSDLSAEQGKEQKGLDIAYATSWSYSPGEMPNLMIPNFNGGSSGGELSTKSETYKALKSAGYAGAEQVVKQMPLYWGPQPFTAGPMYLGAISVFLFILGLVLLKGALKWWIAGVSLLAVLLSWGSNLLFVTEFFFNYIPLYSKFRTVSMILVILQITIPLLAILTLHNLFTKERGAFKEYTKERVKRGVLIAVGITAGISLLFALIPSLAGSFVSQSDSQMPDLLKETLIKDRMSLLQSDAIRSLIFIMLAASVVWFAFIGKIKQNLFYGTLALLIIADLWMVGKRYLNDSHFIKNREFENQYALRAVDKMILQDKDPNYRVLDLSINTFNDSHVSYHHKTIGGYSPAKMQKYQDLIDNHIMREMQKIGNDISGSKTIEEAQGKLSNYPVLNMLNTRYFILGAENAPLINSAAFGNAWLVSKVVTVETLSQELDALNPSRGNSSLYNTELSGSIHDLREIAVVHKEYSHLTDGLSAESVSEQESIYLTEYTPNRLTYRVNALKERLAVFSEIYYPAGWSASIDGVPAEILRANYILRSVKVPAGEHTIVFEFKPDSFTKGELWSRITSGLLLLLTITAIIITVQRRGAGKLKTTN